jgi:putative heme-binding domain-containing protein
VVQAALTALERFESAATWEGVIERLPKLSPRLRVHAVDLLIKRPASAQMLLSAIRQKVVSASDVDATQADQLRRSSDSKLAKLAREILPPPAPRSTVVESFKPAITMSAEVARGRKIYQERCISCHRAQGEGFVVGPDLVTVKNAGKEKLLANILDPSAEVAGNYVAYLLETKDGQALLGLISSDSTSTVTIRQAYGRETVVERSKIKRMTSPGNSLMPDGLETGLSQQDVADLLEFITHVEAEAKPK